MLPGQGLLVLAQVHLALAGVILINREEGTSVTIARTAWVGEAGFWRNHASQAWRPSTGELGSVCPYRGFFLVLGNTLHLLVVDSSQSRGGAAPAWTWAWATFGLDQNSSISSRQPPRSTPPPTVGSLSPLSAGRGDRESLLPASGFPVIWGSPVLGGALRLTS